MAEYIEPDITKAIQIGEHDATTTPTKKVLVYGWDVDGPQKVRLKVSADGRAEVINISQLVPDVYDYINITYVAEGNGAGEIGTVVYKTGGAGGTTVATLTLAYDANDKLSTITKS